MNDKQSLNTSNVFTDSESYRNFFNTVPIGLMLIDENTELIDANEHIFKYFKRHKNNVIGQRFGNLFKCSTAVSENVTCGSGKGCSNCLIRKCMVNVFENDIDTNELEVCHEFTFNNRKITKWFEINVKPVKRLNRRRAFVTLIDITNKKRLEEELTFLGITDELTGLFNRRFILTKLRAIKVSEIKEDFPVSIAMIDIDRFKNVNDTYGHLTGDKVLVKLAEVIIRNTRNTDFTGRYGGEEFLLIFKNSSAENSYKILKRIVLAFENCLIDEIKGPLMFSGGLVEISHEKAQDLDDKYIIERVDALLYKAKREGRNRVFSEVIF